MKQLKLTFLALSVAAATTVNCPAALTSANAPIPPPASAPNAISSLSSGARDIAKLVAAGLSEEVVKAYVQNATYTFDLSADNIVQLKGMGFSPAVLVSMLTHDKTVRDNTRAAVVAAAPVAPAAPAPAQVATYANPAPAVDGAVYSNLAAYGTWASSPDYGWYWQPYSYVNYDYLPSLWLSYGYWGSLPGRGWCWFPRSRFHDFGRFNGGFASAPYRFHSHSSPFAFHASNGISGFHSWMHSGGYFGGGMAYSGFHGGRH